MIVKGTSASFPWRKVINERVVELIQSDSPEYGHDPGQLGKGALARIFSRNN
jgi:hypothetical protein